jgi:hypothetical protein
MTTQLEQTDNKNPENIVYAQVIEKDYAWKDEQETILKKWADKALCFKIMHERAYKRFWCLNAWFNIPIIIISTVTGTGNFASGNFITGSQYFIFALGALNLLGGVLATISTYMGVAQKLEAHRFASINWDKFSRKIQIELAKSRKDRVKARDCIRQSAEEYDRLIEMSPMLPNDIIRWFINLVENNNPETLNECGSCCYECFCFACGCNFCFSCCCPPSKDVNCNLYSLRSKWNEIEVPEIIGRVKPTEIAKLYISSNPPPLTNSKSRFITIQNKTVEVPITTIPNKVIPHIIDMSTYKQTGIELQKINLEDHTNSDTE